MDLAVTHSAWPLPADGTHHDAAIVEALTAGYAARFP